MMHRLLVLLLVAACTGCSIGYRHTVHASKFTRDDGRVAQISGASDTAYLGATFDFRYARVLVPYEFGRRQIFVTEQEDGYRDEIDLIRERRFYRLDIPVLSLWDFDEKSFGGYPGLLRHRNTVDVWLSGETDFMIRNEWWADISVALYRYGKVGFRLYGGGGALPFDAATPQAGTRFPRLWKGQAPYFGGGLEVILTTGEYGLDAFEWIADMDKRDRELWKRRGY